MEDFIGCSPRDHILSSDPVAQVLFPNVPADRFEYFKGPGVRGTIRAATNLLQLWRPDGGNAAGRAVSKFDLARIQISLGLG